MFLVLKKFRLPQRKQVVQFCISVCKPGEADGFLSGENLDSDPLFLYAGCFLTEFRLIRF